MKHDDLGRALRLAVGAPDEADEVPVDPAPVALNNNPALTALIKAQLNATNTP